MSPPRQVLAATDFSGAARRAAERAARLVEEGGGEGTLALSLMHVTAGGALGDLRQWTGSDHALEARLLDDARARLRALADELVGRGATAVRTIAAAGSVVDEILSELERLDAALLVVGARGAGFLRRLLLGTTTERLVRRARRPVLVVRQSARQPYRRALVGLDFSSSSQRALALVRELAPRARLLLLAAFQVPFEEKLRYAGVGDATIEHYRRQARVQAVQSLHALAEGQGLAPSDYEAIIVEGEASQRILEQEQERDCELVVLGKHGRTLGEDLLLGSVTQHVLAEGSVDVLVCPPAADTGAGTQGQSA
ncbi:MAG TPA: universal stress protein [Rubrivivax sp.]|nr:universal stress protein [Rubrivivax sp.]